MDEHVQKAVDCYNAGATVLHVHVRELDGHGSKRLSMFNELLARLRVAVPDMILQVGGSISFAPEGEGEIAKWLSDDTRHMLAELEPAPDQVTIAINTNQMNIVEQMCEADLAGTSLARPDVYRAYREMTIPAGPEWVEEHIRRLTINGIQTHFQLATTAQLETVERMMRNGTCNVPLILTWVAIGGGFDQPNIYNLANFVRAVPDGAVLTLETSMLNVLPLNMMAIAMGLHVRCGIEDNLWTQDRKAKMSSVRQVEQLVRISREFGRDVASAKEARQIYRIGEFYANADETLARNGFAPNRKAGPREHAAADRVRVAVTCPTVLIVPGLRDHVDDHWQTLLAARLQHVRTVPPMGRENLDRAARVGAIEQTAREIDGPIIVVAHSGGVIMVLHWAQWTRRDVRGALLAVPPDFERPMPPGFPTTYALQAGGWLPVPRDLLPFPSIVAASRNDPLAEYDRVNSLARAWGSRLVDLGNVGHLNPASGFGEWPRALPLIDELVNGTAAISDTHISAARI